jgi:hypothetical protein
MRVGRLTQRLIEQVLYDALAREKADGSKITVVLADKEIRERKLLMVLTRCAVGLCWRIRKMLCWRIRRIRERKRGPSN